MPQAIIKGNVSGEHKLPLPSKVFSTGKSGFYLRIVTPIEIDGERYNGQLMLWRAKVAAEPRPKSPNVF